MSQYLERAADLLKKAAEMNEKAPADESAATRHQRRLEIATAYAALAAIDKGLLPQQDGDNIYSQIALDAPAELTGAEPRVN